MRHKLKNKSVLVLNSDYQAIDVTCIRRAVKLSFLNKIDVVKWKNINIQTINNEYPIPSIIRLKRWVNYTRREVALNKSNIFLRDKYCCGYCGSNIRLTIDHIIPKSKGGLNTWDNLITCCKSCNNIKDDKSPKEANMLLINKAYKPSYLKYFSLIHENTNADWKEYLMI